MVVSSFAIGALAQPVFGLGFVDSALTIILINTLSIIPVCFFSSFGPRFGLRQMVLSRFFFGYHFNKLSMCNSQPPAPKLYAERIVNVSLTIQLLCLT